MTEPADERTPAELAQEIEDSDRPSKPQEQRLRAQWNVPRGVQPYIPLGLTMLMLGILVFVVVVSLN